MGKDRHRHSSRHHHRHGGRRERSRENKEAEGVVEVPPPPVQAQEPVDQTPTWSPVYQDPAGGPSYQVLLQPDGTYKYHISGQDAFKGYPPPLPAPTPAPPAAYPTEPADWADGSHISEAPASRHPGQHIFLRTWHDDGGVSISGTASSAMGDFPRALRLTIPEGMGVEIMAARSPGSRSSAHGMGGSDRGRSKHKVHEWLSRSY